MLNLSFKIVWQLPHDDQEWLKWLIQHVLSQLLPQSMHGSILWRWCHLSLRPMSLISSPHGHPRNWVLSQLLSILCKVSRPHQRVWLSSVTQEVWQWSPDHWSQYWLAPVCVTWLSVGRVSLLARGVMCHVWPASWQRDTHDSVTLMTVWNIGGKLEKYVKHHHSPSPEPPRVSESSCPDLNMWPCHPLEHRPAPERGCPSVQRSLMIRLNTWDFTVGQGIL